MSIEKKYLVWGSDPGKKGALVQLDTRPLVPEIVAQFKFPLVGRCYDPHALFDLLSTRLENTASFTLEEVHAIHGTNAKSTFEFGGTLFALRTAAAFLHIPCHMVQPKAWQAVAWAGVPRVTVSVPTKAGKTGKPVPARMKVDPKATSLMAARAIWPSHDFRRTEKCARMDEGIIDAALIGYYGVMRLRGN